MRRSTRSSGGHPTSPEPEIFQEFVERNTRSRVASEDLVILELPRNTRTIRHPSSSEAETHKELSERSTRSRKSSGDPVALELPRITRTTGRRGSGRSPDAPKQSHRDSGKASTASPHKHEKREPSPEDFAPEPTKKRRRSGRLADAESEKEKTDVDGKRMKDEEKKIDKKVLKHSQETDECLSQDSKNKHEKHDQCQQDSSVHTSVKKRRKSGHHAEKEPEKVKSDVTENEDQEEELKAKKKLEKKGKSSREKGRLHIKDNTGKEKQLKETRHDDEETKLQECSSQEQKSGEMAIPSKDGVVSTRRRTRSGRYGTEDGEEELEANQEDDGKRHLKVAQEASVHEKGKLETQSQTRISENWKKSETAHIDLPKLEVDVTEKSSGKQSSKATLNPPLRMSPRRARQPSAQKTQALDNLSESKTMEKVDSIAESRNGESTTDEPSTEQPLEIQKKANTTRRDLSSEFNEIDKSKRSSSKQIKSRTEGDSGTADDSTVLKDGETSTSLQKSPRGKKARSPQKSPRKDAAPLSPRKGLRSCKEPELDVTTVGNGIATGGSNLSSKVDVVAMETDAPTVDVPLLKPALYDSVNDTSQNVGTETQVLQPEEEANQNLNDMLVVDVQKEEDDVREIPDDVAAKIREWRVQEEDSLGFQGDDWYTEDVDEGEPFYFESDHMALKGNKDYRMLLRTITTLEAQRKQAIKDLDKLVTAQREALRNPLKFVHKLQKKDSLHLPSAQRIVLLPEMPWERYLGHADSKELIQGLSHQTRSSLKPKTSDARDNMQSIHPGMMAGPSTGQGAGLVVGEVVDDEKSKSVIRGRLWDESKPETFNRLWTVEEQKRLEDLLVKFPSEDVEARRWEKIAKELGNRNRHQVASRVQKYFIKLSKAGLPVPGRMPNLATYTARKPQKRFINPYKNITLAPSTFLQSVRAPVLMNDDDDAFETEYDYDADSIMEEDDVPPELKDTEEFRELMRLKKLRNVTLRQEAEASHVGYSCDGCGASPIVGVRWHCVTCPAEVSTDLCQGCADEEFTSEVHSSSHRLDPIHSSQSGGFVDSDYTSFTGTSGDYNYLDPNYSPAVLS